MKNKYFFFLAVVVSTTFLFFSCCRKPSGIWNAEVNVDGNKHTTTEVVIDIDGDGKPDPVIIMTQNLNSNRLADGTPFFNNGEKNCYKNMSINCDTLGALYSPEVTVNMSLEDLAQISISEVDSDDDGVIDYVLDIIENSSIQIAEEYEDSLTLDVISQINQILGTNPGSTADRLIVDTLDFAIIINTAIQHSVSSALNENSATINFDLLQQEIASIIQSAIVSYIIQENNGVFVDSALVFNEIVSISNNYSNTITENIAESAATALLETYNASVQQQTYIQGVCPDGWHIPSDAEWMALERGFGMPLAELPLSGISQNSRGASNGVARRMMNELDIRFSGYGSVNGTYAQLGEAVVFYSSTAGIDEDGAYIWVRQFDDSFEGIKRYKHYEASVLSVRCIENR
jgi:uncharacterized protein (TIGR02145 family)